MYDRTPPTSETPFPECGGRDPAEWARQVMRLWRDRGYPILVGAPAEQLHAARQILGL